MEPDLVNTVYKFEMADSRTKRTLQMMTIIHLL